MNKIKIVRTATVSISMKFFLKGQLNFLSTYFDVLAASSDEDYILEDFGRRENIRTVSVPMKRKISVVHDLGSLITLIRLFLKERPTIVHSMTPKSGLLSMLAAKIVGVPVRMHTFTGLIFPERTGLLRLLLITMDRLLCWSATSVYPEGHGVLNDLRNYKITNKPLKVIANGNINGIDLKYFHPNEVAQSTVVEWLVKLGIKERDFVWVYVGRLVGDKGINELVSAFSELPFDSKLLLVGSYENDLDPLKRETLKLIADLDSIISVGFQEDIRPFLAMSSCFVFPSYREGFPNVVLQAGSFNLPCIVTDINGSNEIIIDGQNGLIHESKDAEQLKNAMIRIFSDDSLRYRLSKNARELVVEKFSQEYVWEELFQEYNIQIEELCNI